MRPDGFQILVERSDATVILRPTGELDLAVGDEFDAAVRQLSASSARHIVVDLAGLEFIDSSGLRALLRARSAAAKGRRTFTVANPTPEIERLFDLTGAAALFEMA